MGLVRTFVRLVGLLIAALTSTFTMEPDAVSLVVMTASVIAMVR